MQAENNCEPTNIIQLLQFHTLPSNQRCSEFSTSRTLHNNVYLTSSHRPHKHTYLLKLILSYPSLYHSLSNLCQGWRKLLTVSLISHATVVHSVTDRTIFAFNTFANFFHMVIAVVSHSTVVQSSSPRVDNFRYCTFCVPEHQLKEQGKLKDLTSTWSHSARYWRVVEIHLMMQISRHIADTPHIGMLLLYLKLPWRRVTSLWCGTDLQAVDLDAL